MKRRIYKVTILKYILRVFDRNMFAASSLH